MGTETRTGTIDLIELVTPDIEASKLFYAGLLGWTFEHGEDRWLAVDDGKRVAVLDHRSPTIGDMVLPATWTVGIRVDHVGESLTRLTSLGATVVHPPHEVAAGWRTALLRDPSGAVFAIVEASHDLRIEARSGTGSLGACELLTHGRSDSVRFYGEGFGWSVPPHDHGSYTSFFLHGDPVAGLVHGTERLPHLTASTWLPFFRVPDPDDAAARAASLGATVVAPTRRVDSQTFAVVEDPTGALVGLLADVLVPHRV